MNDLYYQINGCIQTFEEADNPSLVDSITSERLSEIVMANDMFGQSFYAKEIGINQSNIDFLARTKSQIFELIDQILTYKDYLTEEQILAIERIHDSRFFNLVSNPQDTPATRAFFSSNQFKEGIIEELGGVISDMKQLKRSVQ
jgi:hypothetical protein